MMVTANGAGGVPPLFPPPAHRNGPGGAEQAPEAGRSYDQVEISGAPSGEHQFQRELVARLSREVRTAHTTGDIQRVGLEVRRGLYRADPSALAARLLLERSAHETDGL